MPNRLPNRFINASLKYDGLTSDTTIAGTWGGATWASMTWMCWAKLNAISTTDVLAALISSTGANFMHFQFNKDVGSNLAVYINSGVILMSAPTQYQLMGRWHHIAVSTQSGATKIYLDGVLFSSDTTTYTNITQATALKFGEGFGSSRDAYCNMTDVAVFKAADGTGALSQAQVQQAMLNGPSKAISSTLYGYWPHSDGNGTTLTDTITGNNGTISGAAWSSETPTGIRANALIEYPASVTITSPQYVDLTASTLDTSGSFTVSCWAKFSSVSSIAAIIGKNQAGNFGFQTYVLNNGTLSTQFKNGGGIDIFGGSVVTGRWYHLLITVNSANVASFYVNTVLTGSGTITAGRNNLGVFRAGKSSDAFWGCMTGNVTRVRAYNVTLNHNDVIRDYNQQPVTGLLNSWAFNEGGGTNAVDSVSGQNGTLNSAGWSTNGPSISRTAVS